MTTINIPVHCPQCTSEKIVKNGHKSNGQQNYQCKNCKKKFPSNLSIQWCLSNGVIHMFNAVSSVFCVAMWVFEILQSIIRFLSDRSVMLRVLNTLKKHGKQAITPRKTEYDTVQVDELWSFVGNKKNKHWHTVCLLLLKPKKFLRMSVVLVEYQRSGNSMINCEDCKLHSLIPIIGKRSRVSFQRKSTAQASEEHSTLKALIRVCEHEIGGLSVEQRAFRSHTRTIITR
jgi:hypothetical protein